MQSMALAGRPHNVVAQHAVYWSLILYVNMYDLLQADFWQIAKPRMVKNSSLKVNVSVAKKAAQEYLLTVPDEGAGGE